MSSKRALRIAEQLGRRAGGVFARFGTPSPNPLTKGPADLAAAWRRGYFAAGARPGGRRPRA